MKKLFHRGNIAIRFGVYFLLAAILITSFFYQFYGKLEQVLKQQAQTYLTENANQAVNSLSKKISDVFYRLEVFSAFLAKQDKLNNDSLSALGAEQTLANQESRFAITLTDGTMYSNDAIFLAAAKQQYLKTAINGNNAISNLLISPTDRMPCVIFAVPIYKADKIIGVLQCAYTQEIFGDFISPASFNGDGRTLLIQKDGTVLVGSTRIQPGENYFEKIKQANMKSGITVKQFADKIANDESGLVEYTYMGETDYTNFVSANQASWYIISTVPVNYIQSQSEQISSYVLFMMFEITAVFILMVIIIIAVQRRNEKRLSDSKQEFETLADNIPGGVLQCSVDENNRPDFVSEGCLRLFGYTQEQFMEKCENGLENIIYEKDRARAVESIGCQIRNHHHVRTEFRIVDADGRLKWVLYRGRVIRNSAGRNSQYVVLMDITHIKKTQEELRQSMERYRIVTDQMDCIIYEYNLLNDTVYVSANFLKIFGYEIPKYRFPMSLKENNVIHPDDLHIADEHYRRIHGGAPSGDIELRIRKSDDSYLWCRVQTTTIFDDLGAPVKSIAKVTDINAEKMAKQHLLDQAQHDCLTGIYNKSAGISMIDKYLKEDNGSSVCVLCVLDIDYFKQANDTYGHLFGDEVLLTVSTKIKALFRSSDVICRIGGDEFVVFLKNVETESGIEDKARAICDAFHNIVFDSHSEFKISVSIGIAVSPKDGKDYLELFRKADLALYQTKKNGKDGYTIYCDGQMAVKHAVPHEGE